MKIKSLRPPMGSITEIINSGSSQNSPELPKDKIKQAKIDSSPVRTISKETVNFMDSSICDDHSQSNRRIINQLVIRNHSLPGIGIDSNNSLSDKVSSDHLGHLWRVRNRFD